MYPIHDFTVAEEAFPASILDFMPPMKDIPREFHMGTHGKFQDFFTDMFFSGLENVELIPKEGVDSERAWQHLCCIARSYEPKHEHKEAAFAYLMSQWFEDVKWTRRKKGAE